MDAANDPHCALLTKQIDESSGALARVLQATVLDAKAEVAQEAHVQLMQQQRVHAQVQEDLHARLDAANQRMAQLEASLARSHEQCNKLAGAVAMTWTRGHGKLEKMFALSAWRADASSSKAYAEASVSAWGHHRRYMMRTVLCGWRTVARLSRHEAIDAFWGENMRTLRNMLQEHYEPIVQEVQDALEAARAETAAALEAKANVENELKTAFMRAASKLNLEAVSIVHGAQS